MNAIRTTCAWCHALICDGALVNGKESHGICKACASDMEQEIKVGQ